MKGRAIIAGFILLCLGFALGFLAATALQPEVEQEEVEPVPMVRA